MVVGVAAAAAVLGEGKEGEGEGGGLCEGDASDSGVPAPPIPSED